MTRTSDVTIKDELRPGDIIWNKSRKGSRTDSVGPDVKFREGYIRKKERQVGVYNPNVVPDSERVCSTDEGSSKCPHKGF